MIPILSVVLSKIPPPRRARTVFATAAGALITLAVLLATPVAAYAVDPFAGRWNIEPGTVIELSRNGAGFYEGKLLEKSPTSRLCWSVNEVVLQLSGGQGTEFLGRYAQYESEWPTCGPRVDDGFLTAEFNRAGTSAQLRFRG